jgi:hypothetical protein
MLLSFFIQGAGQLYKGQLLSRIVWLMLTATRRSPFTG